MELPGETKKSSLIEKPQFQPWHSRKRNYINQYMLRLTNSTLCISATGEKENGFWKRNSNLILSNCMRIKNQVWFETDKHELVLGQILCLEATGGSSSSPPVLQKCHEMGGDQEWKHRNEVLNQLNFC